MAKLRDMEHLLRLLAVFVIGLVLFIVVRAQLVPKGFGQYGHYRSGAPSEIAATPIAYAGHQQCELCHSDIAEIKKTGKHAGVNCEACHGALANHAADPSSMKPKLPDAAVLCARCHQKDVAKPAKFPQVDTAQHGSGNNCRNCHQPHTPLEMNTTGAGS